MANTKDPKVNPANDNANPNADIIPGHVKRVKEDWDKKRGNGSVAIARNPFSNQAVVFTKMEFEGNCVRVWTGDYEGAEPQYVIVHPRTQYPVSEQSNQFVEDPLTALAISITGVNAQ